MPHLTCRLQLLLQVVVAAVPHLEEEEVAARPKVEAGEGGLLQEKIRR